MLKRIRIDDDTQETEVYTQVSQPASGGVRVPRRKLTRTKTISKVTGAGSLNKIINKAIMRSMETKENQLTRGESTAIQISQQITDLDVYDIIPPIAQGSGEAGRIGNRIRPVKFTLRVQLYCFNLGASIPPTYFDVYIFKSKSRNQADGLPTLFDMQNFLQDDNIAKQYNGSSLDGLRPLNTDKFTLVAKRRVMLFNPFNTTSQLSSTAQVSPSMTLYFDLSKHIKKQFTYNDNTSLAENDNMLIAIAATQTDGVIVGGSAANTVGSYRLISNIKYKDA